MKVYIITKEPFPNGMAATNRIKCYARAITEQGVECEILNFTRTEVYGKEPKNTIGKGYYEGIPFRYIGGTPLRASNVIVRQLNDRLDRWKLKTYLKCNLREGDIVLGYIGTDVLYVNQLIKITHNCGAKYIRELCEYPYGTSVESKAIIKNREITFSEQFPICDGFIAISDALVNVALNYKSSKAKVLKVPILVDFDSYNLIDRSKEAKFPYIFHSGTLYEQKDGILGMIEAFGIAKQKKDLEVHFISTGTIDKSPHSTEIRKIISKYNIENYIHFTGYLSDEELKDYLAKASLVIINKYRTNQNLYCFSTKLGEYLAASKPVIITDVGEAMNWLKNGESGYIVESENVNALSDKIVEAFSNDAKLQHVASQGKELCKKHFSYQSHGKRLVNFFKDLSK